MLLYDEFWYDYVKPKYGDKAKWCNMDIDIYRRLIVYKKQMVFIKIFQKMFKLDLILQIMNQVDHCLKEKIKKYLD